MHAVTIGRSTSQWEGLGLWLRQRRSRHAVTVEVAGGAGDGGRWRGGPVGDRRMRRVSARELGGFELHVGDFLLRVHHMVGRRGCGGCWWCRRRLRPHYGLDLQFDGNNRLWGDSDHAVTVLVFLYVVRNC